MLAIYVRYFFAVMRADMFEEAYDVANALSALPPALQPEADLFAELAEWATARGEESLAEIAARQVRASTRRRLYVNLSRAWFLGGSARQSTEVRRR